MSRFLTVVAAVGGLCGVASLLLGFIGLPVETPAPQLAERLYSQVSLHLWFVEILLIVVAVAVGAVGLIGYQSLREAAVAMARSEARRVAEEHLSEHRESLRRGLRNEEGDDERVVREGSS